MVYSKSEEDGYTDLCSVLDDAEVGDTIYFGVPSRPCPSRFVPGADWIAEHIHESAYDNCGEWAEDNIEISPEAYKVLDKLLEDWAKEHVKITFFMVEDVQSREVTAEDLE
jgi:hypothetical protein